VPPGVAAGLVRYSWTTLGKKVNGDLISTTECRAGSGTLRSTGAKTGITGFDIFSRCGPPRRWLIDCGRVDHPRRVGQQMSFFLRAGFCVLAFYTPAPPCPFARFIREMKTGGQNGQGRWRERAVEALDGAKDQGRIGR
jgi:hypothetical protein